MINQVGSRLAYKNAKNAIRRAGKSTAGAVLSQSYLRLETAFVAGQANYRFDVLVNESVSGSQNFPTCNKLNLQDSFYIASMGVFIGVPSAVGDTTFPLLTYPNRTQLGANSDNYNTFYNGYLSITMNQRVIVPYWNLNRHYCANQTQETATLIDQANLGSDGFYPVEPMWVLSGDKKNEITITLPAGLSTIQANSRIVIVMNGILAQNVTSVN